MNAVVRWPADERLFFLGRNGIGKCTGLDIFEFEGVLELRPVTSKNQIGRAQLNLPVTAVPRLVKSLVRLHRRAAKQRSRKVAS
jgi:hypothetical protein